MIWVRFLTNCSFDLHPKFLSSVFRCEGVAAVKASVNRDNFIAGRRTLGGVCHTLQVTLTMIVTDCHEDIEWSEQQSLILFYSMILLFCQWRTSTATVTGWSWGGMLLTALWSDQTSLLRAWQVLYCCRLSTYLCWGLHLIDKSLEQTVTLSPICKMTNTFARVLAKHENGMLLQHIWVDTHAYTCVVASVVGPSTPTCRSCTNGDCENNLLPDLLQQGLLTSGYFSILSSVKPAGNFEGAVHISLRPNVSHSWTERTVRNTNIFSLETR